MIYFFQDGEEARNLVNGKLDNLRRLEAKKNELEKEEERILKDAISRRKSEDTPTSDEGPPPLPSTPPPLGDHGGMVDDHEPFGAAQRLDALISTNLKTNGHASHSQASKKVSFASSAEPLDEIPEITQENAEKLSQLEKYEKDPNVSQNFESILSVIQVRVFLKTLPLS